MVSCPSSHSAWASAGGALGGRSVSGSAAPSTPLLSSAADMDDVALAGYSIAMLGDYIPETWQHKLRGTFGVPEQGRAGGVYASAVQLVCHHLILPACRCSSASTEQPGPACGSWAGDEAPAAGFQGDCQEARQRRG